jgi:hypothetical protein
MTANRNAAIARDLTVVSTLADVLRMAKTPRFFVDKNATGSIGIEKIEHKIWCRLKSCGHEKTDLATNRDESQSITRFSQKVGEF